MRECVRGRIVPQNLLKRLVIDKAGRILGDIKLPLLKLLSEFPGVIARQSAETEPTYRPLRKTTTAEGQT